MAAKAREFQEQITFSRLIPVTFTIKCIKTKRFFFFFFSPQYLKKKKKKIFFIGHEYIPKFVMNIMCV